MFEFDREMIPAPIAPFVSASTSLRFHRVIDDLCAPAINPRDFVLIAPIGDWKGEGYYLVQDPLGTPVVYHCTAYGSRSNLGVRLGKLNPLYGDRAETVSYADFQERILGKVVMTCKMQDFAPALDLKRAAGHLKPTDARHGCTGGRFSYYFPCSSMRRAL